MTNLSDGEVCGRPDTSLEVLGPHAAGDVFLFRAHRIGVDGCSGRLSASEPLFTIFSGIPVVTAATPKPCRRPLGDICDPIFHNDYVRMDIDSQNSRRGFATFAVNAQVTQFDQLEGDAADNITRAGDWKAAVCRTKRGWNCEMFIPFALLRYPRGAAAQRSSLQASQKSPGHLAGAFCVTRSLRRMPAGSAGPHGC